jgi:hypothetical protein
MCLDWLERYDEAEADFKPAVRWKGRSILSPPLIWNSPEKD